MAKNNVKPNNFNQKNTKPANKKAAPAKPKAKEIEKDNGPKVIIYKKGMTVMDAAEGFDKPVKQIILKLMQLGVMSNQNQPIEKDMVELLAIDFGYEVKDEVVTDLTRFEDIVIKDDEKDLVRRPAVVTIMGHVDHGKTTLLDTIRNSRVVSNEAGGITQHIGAYQVEHNGNPITFIDTPGHAAFTQMRARGASITDIVVLVVAADDGVMPQTEEAIAHAKAAGCPIIVAINKIDKPNANPDRVTQELANLGLLSVDWGGDTIFVNISALKGMGVDDLLGMIELVADENNILANPNRPAIGTVIEAKLDKGKGPLATLLVQNGTLHVGDIVICGNTYGKVRTMEDDRNIRYKEAKPSTALSITGLNEVPQAGDKFMVVKDERSARDAAIERAKNAKNAEFIPAKKLSFDELLSNSSEDKSKELNLIIKCDVQGSVEALKNSLEKINVEDLKVKVIRSSVGAITDTDISLAEASNAIIIGFNVRPVSNVRNLAKEKNIEIRLYDVIYKVMDDITLALKGMLQPVFEEVVTGQAEVRNIFKNSIVGTIAGCYVTDGVIERSSLVRVLIDGIVIYSGKMASLRRFKDDVKEVKNGFECGITIEKYNDLKEGDIIEASIMKEVSR